jgi:NitT/TauT family transport system substrate-binding protein
MIARRHAVAALGAFASTAPLWPHLAGAQTVETIRVAKLTGVSDCPFYIGEAKGYFRDAGVNVEWTTFPQSNQVVPAMTTGRLDAMGASVTAAIWNAVGAGLPIKIVADRGLDYPPYGGLMLVVRTDLSKSGRVKSVRDLSGLKVAEPGRGSSNLPILVRFLRAAGLKYDDVQHLFLPFPDQIAALKNGSIDASVLIEPFGTGAVREGFATRLGIDTDVYPNHQISALMYNGDFMQKRPDVARRYMVGYVRALRYYHDALKDGKFAGPTANDVLAILQQNINLPDPTIFRVMIPSGDTTNGRVDVASLQFDYDVYHEQGLIDKPVNVRDFVDSSFADAADKQLGRYVPAR